MMRTILAGALLLMFIGNHADARAEGLTVGSPAPPLQVAKWVKGEKVDKLEKGQVYVVEFWATWCGPCKVSIPHLTELQKKYPGVTFIGVSVFENDPSRVEPFVKEMGAKMDYRVATDDGAGADGKMADGWLRAAEEDGIPTSFIIDKTGTVAWIGHPSGMDKPLEQIVAGKYDLKAAISERTERKAMRQFLEELKAKVDPLLRDKVKNAKAIVDAIDAAVKDHPAIEETVATTKFDVLLLTDREAASAYAAKLLDSTCKDDETSLNYLAWSIIDPETKIEDSKRDVKLALKIAQRASALGHDNNPEILDTLALATFLNGDAAKALELQDKAVKMMTEKNPDMVERLEKYRKAAAAK